MGDYSVKITEDLVVQISKHHGSLYNTIFWIVIEKHRQIWTTEHQIKI